MNPEVETEQVQTEVSENQRAVYETPHLEQHGDLKAVVGASI